MRRVLEHAKKDAPIEACGYLAERQDGVITAYYPLFNVDRTSEHFSFDPKEQFAAMRDARSKGLNLRAVYHSHPHTPAWPSEEDKKLAYDSGMSYVIVSLAYDREDVKAFKIDAEAAREIVMEIIDDGGI